MLRKHGVPWEEVERSPRAAEYSPSSFSQCVYEVALGNADIAFMNALVTTDRRALSVFSGPIMNDEYFLVIKREKQELSFAEAIARPFRPFSTDLWLTVIVVLSIAGISLSYEGTHQGAQTLD